jgi:hypothetical protein
VSLPAEQSLGGPSLPFNLSSDGKRLVYVAQAGTTQQLNVRDLDDFEARYRQAQSLAYLLAHLSQFFDDLCVDPVNVIYAASIAGEKDEPAVPVVLDRDTDL